MGNDGKGYPPPPPPINPRAKAALPVGVRDGDVLIVPTDNEYVSDDEREFYKAKIIEAFGVDVRVVFISGKFGVTVLRPERRA